MVNINSRDLFNLSAYLFDVYQPVSSLNVGDFLACSCRPHHIKQKNEHESKKQQDAEKWYLHMFTHI